MTTKLNTRQQRFVELIAIGNNAGESMGHAMYHTKDGRTALCIADRKLATI